MKSEKCFKKMMDYDVPYECACCGKKTSNYLCSKCAAPKQERDIAWYVKYANGKDNDVTHYMGLVNWAIEELKAYGHITAANTLVRMARGDELHRSPCSAEDG